MLSKSITTRQLCSSREAMVSLATGGFDVVGVLNDVINIIRADTGRTVEFYTSIAGFKINEEDFDRYMDIDVTSATVHQPLSDRINANKFVDSIKHAINQCYQNNKTEFVHLNQHGNDDPINTLIRGNGEDFNKAMLHLLG
jgi:hypothetical protein